MKNLPNAQKLIAKPVVDVDNLALRPLSNRQSLESLFKDSQTLIGCAARMGAKLQPSWNNLQSLSGIKGVLSSKTVAPFAKVI